MSDVNSLSSRLDAEFAAIDEKIKQYRTEQIEEHKGRQQRLEQLARTFDELREIWRPRLELLMQKFGQRIQATPNVVPSARDVTFDFQSELARVQLKFAASTDQDVRKVILRYDLEIIPILMHFKPHDEIEFPLDAVDKDAVARWIDDRIVDFVQTYFSLGKNEYYLKEHMVEDPVAHIRFPSMAAAATTEVRGKKLYFISEETRREFERQQASPSK
jgi:YHS domain-containing protein